MGISFGSINTGLPKNIVEQIVAAEKIPIQKMQVKKTKIKEKEGLLNELKGYVQNLRTKVNKNRNYRDFGEIKVSTNEDIVSVMADKKMAKPGEFRFEVKRMAQKSSALTSGFPDSDKSYVGVGFIEYYLPDGENYSMFIDTNDATLDGVAKLINDDRGNGLHATVINDGTDTKLPWRILISLDDMGDQKAAKFPYIYLVDGEEDLYIDKERKAHDAIVKLDGFEIETPNNHITNLIPGLTIDLNRAEEGKEFSIKISQDTDKAGLKILGFVKEINNILKFINVQNSMDENTDTTRTLGGDSMLRALESKVRRTIFTPIKTSKGNIRISSLGITFQKNGLLKVDKNKFFSELNSDFNKTSEILYGFFNNKGDKTSGFIDNIHSFADQSLKFPYGPLALKKQTLRQNIDQINRSIQNKERIISHKEKNIRNRFARLERQISNLKGQGAGLAALGVNTGSGPKLG
ncbi:MAG: hypothetical protein DRQ88_05145 [Epsilonproteobacteria bacterium]|nr:MAG: hypothetical protein DRQ89_04610 [Campylobacterota bacterium]RLA66814.1 MAG: hypothetical protein DRQ88_05145 [Campylobacterota bacterium]